MDVVYRLLGSLKKLGLNHLTKIMLNVASFFVTSFLRTLYLHNTYFPNDEMCKVVLETLN